jgi:hypothetical protein
MLYSEVVQRRTTERDKGVLRPDYRLKNAFFIEATTYGATVLILAT